MSGVVDTSALNAERTADPRRIGVVQKIKAYVALTKPRVIELLLVTTAPVMVLAAQGIPNLWLVLATLVVEEGHSHRRRPRGDDLPVLTQ